MRIYASNGPAGDGSGNSEPHWHAGDRLHVTARRAAVGGGLVYPEMDVIASEDGGGQGWDVFDGIEVQTGYEVSFYGFSVESVASPASGANPR